MGATFTACRVEDLNHYTVYYSDVHRCRIALLESAGRICDLPDRWANLYFQSITKMRSDTEHILEDMFMEMRGQIRGLDGSNGFRDVLIGCLSFCNHSDCCCAWSNDSCEKIAKALKYAIDDPETRVECVESLKGLYDIFVQGSKENHEVRIYRGMMNERNQMPVLRWKNYAVRIQ